MDAYPIKFQPLFKERLWGAQNLRLVFAKNAPPEKKIGESWELADLPQDQTLIANGALQGLSLSEAIDREPELMTGRRGFPLPFPLLVKFLDCAEALSVQVHPDQDACRRLGRGDTKTEFWYVVRAAKGAVIYKGLQPGVTREVFEQAIASGTVERTLARLPVAAGECHFLPAGTPHAIGAGLLIAEIQTPSDTTFRVFDWGRRDERGQPRPLHIREALESIHFDAGEDDLPVSREGVLVSCPFFRVEKRSVPAGRSESFRPGRPRVLIVISGRSEISGAGEKEAVRAGDTLFVPAAFSGALAASEPFEYLSATVPSGLS